MEKSPRLERGECISASLCWFSLKGGRIKGVHSGIRRSSYSEDEVFLKRKKTSSTENSNLHLTFKCFRRFQLKYVL